MTKNQSRLFVVGSLALMAALVFGSLRYADSLSGCFLAADEMPRVLGTGVALESLEAFRSMSPQDRALVARDLIESKKAEYVGRKPEEVLTKLGPSDGSFHTPGFPNYRIQASQEWSLVFALNKEGFVREAFVWRDTCKN